MEPVIIVEYSPEWSRRFEQLAGPLREALGDVALRIDHIGSTSIAGMPAKPIIDIQISVARLEPAAPFRRPLEGIGYVYRSGNPELTKRYFREAPGNDRTHIHVREIGTWNQQLALLFRDYLRQNRVDSELYAAEKYRLAAMHRENRSAYVESKDKVIWEILYRADTWAKETGWRAAESDA